MTPPSETTALSASLLHFPIHEGSPVTHAGPLPEACDVVIIGGGVIGVMTAWFLAEQGQKVVLCEKGRIAGEQSSRNWGWVRQQGRDLGELPIAIESLGHWQRLQQAIPQIGFRRLGVLYSARDEAKLARHESWLSGAKPFGVDSRMLSAAEMARLTGGELWKGGLYTASDAMAEPWSAIPAIAAALAARVSLRENCAVRALELQNGAVRGVITEHGAIRAERVVVAAGAWSSLLLRAHGVMIPQLSVRSSVAQTEAVAVAYQGGMSDVDFACRQRADGGLTLAAASHGFYIGPDAFRHFFKYLKVMKDEAGTRFSLLAPAGYPDAWRTARRWSPDQISPFERTRILNPPPDLAALERAAVALGKALPETGRPRLKRAWAGMIDTMPDVVPIVDHAPLAGLTIATGMAGHGFGIGPGFGRIIADMVQGRDPGHDMRRFRFARFSDGSPILPGPGL
jgi:glycine/D-amino acid oxidase-like deaminating enzyme